MLQRRYGNTTICYLSIALAALIAVENGDADAYAMPGDWCYFLQENNLQNIRIGDGISDDVASR